MTDASSSAWYRRPPQLSTLPRRPIPTPHTLIGSDAVPLRVFLLQRAWHDLQSLFDEDPQNAADSQETPATEVDVLEQAGIVLGNVYEDEQGPYIVIEGALPAPHTRATSGGLTFTEQTWAALRPVCAEEFADQVVVGSFRVRPGQGTNLSDYDRYVTRRFFPDWWQVTYIIDPSQQRQALFHWRDDRLHSLPGLWVCTVAHQERAATPPVDATQGAPTRRRLGEGADSLDETEASEFTAGRLLPKGVSQRSVVIALGTVVLLLLALATLVPMPGSLPALQRRLKETTDLREQLTAEALALQRHHEQLQHLLLLSTGADEPAPGHQDPTPTPSSGTAGTAATESAGSGLDHADHYVVRPGDTLWSISTRMLGDPYAYTELAEKNRISDPDLILPGWELRIGTK